MPKEEEGMCFRDMEIFNMSLLAKQGWRVIQEPNSLLSKMLKARYFLRTSFMEAKTCYQSSFAWRSLLKGRDTLENGLWWQVGNGTKISVFKDPWIPGLSRFKPISNPLEYGDELLVSNMIDWESKRWDEDMVRAILHKDDADIVLTIRIIEAWNEDELNWHYTKDGVFTVQSVYQMLMKDFIDREIACNSDQSSSFLGKWDRCDCSRRCPRNLMMPPTGFIKLNVDASLDPFSGSGIGVIARDESGNVRFMASKKICISPVSASPQRYPTFQFLPQIIIQTHYVFIRPLSPLYNQPPNPLPFSVFLPVSQRSVNSITTTNPQSSFISNSHELLQSATAPRRSSSPSRLSTGGVSERRLPSAGLSASWLPPARLPSPAGIPSPRLPCLRPSSSSVRSAASSSSAESERRFHGRLFGYAVLLLPA